MMKPVTLHANFKTCILLTRYKAYIFKVRLFSLNFLNVATRKPAWSMSLIALHLFWAVLPCQEGCEEPPTILALWRRHGPPGPCILSRVQQRVLQEQPSLSLDPGEVDVLGALAL